MAVAQKMSEQGYEAFVWSHPVAQRELHNGVLVEKPGKSWEHGQIPALLGHFLLSRLDPAHYRAVIELRVRPPTANVFVPDLMVVPADDGEPFRGRPGVLAIVSDPSPLVVEVWSDTTGDYDVDTKIPVCNQRGDLEIWRIHPFERTLTRWVRQPDGSNAETVRRGGTIALSVLPGVSIDLDRLFGL